MIVLDSESLRKLQLIELEILVEIERICKKNHINYTITGGTLLGAVRHGGFIPWDDDADVSMLRSEYQRFREACKKDLDISRYYFQDIENTKGYRWGYAKVRRKDSVFLREGQEDMPYEQGIFVDIFPRDGVPNGVIRHKIHVLLCFVVRKMMWSVIGRKTAKTRIQRWIYQLLYMISKDNILQIYRHLVQYSNKEKTKYVRTLTFPLPNQLKGYERKWYQDYTRVYFEGYEFQVEASYKKWLLQEFGEYTKLPPVEKRKIHPITEIKFPD